ncbi:MAG TPA: dihydropteroate synthase [Thiomicrorhabdus sp.]|nr:dihydropteroate synthase [Thiomicrorhabdus sp.]
MFSIQKFIEHKSQKDNMPTIMGILNVTPDSFSDGGRFITPAAMEAQVLNLLSGGADILDVGGESTRPGATIVSLSEELERVVPVIEWIAKRFDVIVSVDTYKPEVMQEAVAVGAKIINDVNALGEEGAMDVVVDSGVSVCLMHKQGVFETMQDAPVYDDVLLEVKSFLLTRAHCCEQAGVAADKIILDPGFGFGKTFEHNKILFQSLEVLTALKYPLLVGVSRKRMIADILKTSSLIERVSGSVSAAVLAVLKGAEIVRVHDVKETVDALKITMRLM